MTTVLLKTHVNAHAADVFAALLRQEQRDRELAFGTNIIRWSQRVDASPGALTISVEQIDGDFDRYRGRWHVAAARNGCDVRFELEFGFGVPIYDRIVEPMVAQVIESSAQLSIHTPPTE
jgi:ribosome-associated toxin RatA of RatAB toxin-antitoxin module